MTTHESQESKIWKRPHHYKYPLIFSPISYKGKYYYRSGSTKKELSGQALTEFLLKKMGQTWDELPEERAKLADVDEASIRKYIKDVKGSGRFPALDELKTSLKAI